MLRAWDLRARRPSTAVERTGTKARSTAATITGSMLLENQMAIRPASQTVPLAMTNSEPASFVPVQLGTAVTKNPAITAAV